MLELKDIVKEYKTADETVTALKGLSLQFRKSEFVSILGPSGCGKTTLLNIIGGLDRYTSGDLIINGKSTKQFSDKEWDTYRNHSVGFVFQSYNLIPHQTVLENVELALTLSGIGAKERRERAIAVLEKVGLKNKINVRPNQLSGGQMQRVAIARALINDPEILLADEPTGALDSKTSVQIMELLKEISGDRLIIMVTHNPELAEKYSSRIIRLLDGQLVNDEKPLSEQEIEEEKTIDSNEKRTNKGRKKTSMSFLTALSLSFRNLMTKKGRTFLVSFAGSIGIIGIALILSLSSGFQTYIDRVQAETLSNYPITVQDSYSDMTSVMQDMKSDDKNAFPSDGKITSDDALSEMMKAYNGSQVKNNLAAFKKYLDKGEYDKTKITAVKYTYSLTFETYGTDKNGEIQKLQNTLEKLKEMGVTSSSLSMYANMTGGSTKSWTEALDNEEFLKSQYDLIGGGKWMDFSADDEVMVVVDKYNRLPDYILPALGLADPNELLYPLMKAAPNVTDELLALIGVKEVNEEDKFKSLNAADLIGKEFTVLTPAERYKKSGEAYKAVSLKEDGFNEILSGGKKVKIVGIIRQKENVSSGALSAGVVYNKNLTKTLLNTVGLQEVVKAQKASPDIDVTTNAPFGTYEIGGTKITTSYESNMLNFGYADESNPASISIYASSFENKDYIVDYINKYNDGLSEENKNDKISYTDYLGIMMSSITTIINAVSYVLIGFVSVSLVVSSIMIGIITYISVLERIKEIGVLRALGASKKDVARVFNAETLIIGFSAGIIGIGITVLLNLPISAIIYALADIKNVAVLPWQGGVILVAISMILTFIAGLIPSRIASKKDPVIALRSE